VTETVQPTSTDWSVTGERDAQLVAPDWSPADPIAIAGVTSKQMANVLTDTGCLTEIWRTDWALDDLPVDQIFQRTLDVGRATDWHAHAQTTDHLFCAVGRLRLTLYDARRASPTHGRVAVLRLGHERPAIVTVPPGVWHAVRNVGESTVLYVNVVDRAYDYAAPDNYRLPSETPLIPVDV
jgi:dTDP-4-dehydrorhamnose 3,5-epimerase